MPNETAFASSHRQKKTWLTALAVLAVLLVFATVAALTMPASAMTGQGGSTPETAEIAATGETATPAPTEAPESVQAQEQAQADTAALPTGVQVPEGYTDKRTVRDEENGFAVTVYAPEGVIPADATLHATLLPTDSEEYKQAVIDAIKTEGASVKGITSEGGYTFDEYNNPIKDAVIIKVTGGEEVFDRMF